MPYTNPYADLLLLDRPHSDRLAMDRRKRAKQFAPFDALHGFSSAVHLKEQLYEPRRDLSDQAREELNYILKSLEPGEPIRLCYFEPAPGGHRSIGTYRWTSGTFKGIDLLKRQLLLDETRIPLYALYSLDPA